MAHYLGNEKVQIIADGVIYTLQLLSETPITESHVLLSSDNYILQDSNGIVLTTKGDE